MLFILTGLLVCFILIIFSGARLCVYGDIIAEQSGMGKAWFGLIMMAAVTSLPELCTGISAIAFVATPNIAVGNVIGSCAFNLLIFVILDLLIKRKPIYHIISQTHVLACLVGIILLTVFLISVVYSGQLPMIGWVSSASLVLLVLYIAAVYVIFHNEQKQAAAKPVVIQQPAATVISLRTAIKRYIFYAGIVVIGAIALPYFADSLAQQTGLSKSFIGTLLVAAATSLPELAVSIAAVRMGSTDIAAGNLLGSNIFNILIVSLEDMLYKKGALLAAVDNSHTISGITTILMSAVVGVGIMYNASSKRFLLSTPSVILLLLYLALMLILFYA